MFPSKFDICNLQIIIISFCEFSVGPNVTDTLTPALSYTGVSNANLELYSACPSGEFTPPECELVFSCVVSYLKITYSGSL